MAANALSTVARICFLSSDVVLDVAAVNSHSSFSPHFARLQPYQPPQLTNVPNGADLGLKITKAIPNASLITVTLSAEKDSLNRLIPSLSALPASVPLVISVAVNGDLSDVLPLRTAVDFLIHSATHEQAHDNSLISARLARMERVKVLHAFQAYSHDHVDQVDELKVKPFLASPKQDNTNDHLNGNATEETYQSLLADQIVEDGRLKQYNDAAIATRGLIQREILPLHATEHPRSTIGLISLGNSIPLDALPSDFTLLELSLIHPLPVSQILSSLSTSITRILTLEQVYRWPVKWTPLYLEILSVIQHIESSRRPILASGILAELPKLSHEVRSNISGLVNDISPSTPRSRLVLGTVPYHSSERPRVPHVPKHESAYTKVLELVFGERLEISNSPHLVQTKGEVATRPEFALGRVEAHLAEQVELTNAVKELLGATRDRIELPPHLRHLLEQWLHAKSDRARSAKIGHEVTSELSSKPLDHPAARTILSLGHQFSPMSHWIIGSDAWSYDIGQSGLHHAIASGLNVNLLILDTTPYSTRNAADPDKRKKDIGLYAMNYGNVYVSSVAIYSSYGQVLRTLMEADQFNGPSVVLAYLPYFTEDDPALTILKETKLAVDNAYWPLYRWNPSRSENEMFSLDSETIKSELQEFLDRQSHLSQLVAAEPSLAAELVTSLGSKLSEARSKKAAEAYDSMLGGLSGPPLTILYASDGGTAEKYAKRLVTRAKLRGVTAKVSSMDAFPLEDLKNEEFVAFVTSTAGQGEPPQNGRETFKAFNAAATRGDKLFTSLKFTVFGMGDSHYWPRPEDAHYYNKPGKDLDRRLEQLGGERVADLGLGDDQDADGPMTGYKVWEPLLWKALGVEGVEVTEAEPEPVTNEHIKIASNFLRGTIAEGLVDETTGSLSASDGQLTKFHGIYQQDDRDIRDERSAQGLEPAYSFMIRVRMPGGVCTPAQWLAMDRISDEHGNSTFKLTTRQTFQFHGVIKKHLKPSIQAINRALLDTIAACGDVNRYALNFI